MYSVQILYLYFFISALCIAHLYRVFGGIDIPYSDVCPNKAALNIIFQKNDLIKILCIPKSVNSSFERVQHIKKATDKPFIKLSLYIRNHSFNITAAYIAKRFCLTINDGR